MVTGDLFAPVIECVIANPAIASRCVKVMLTMKTLTQDNPREETYTLDDEEGISRI